MTYEPVDVFPDPQAGDHIFIKNGRHDNLWPEQIERVTATQIVVGRTRYLRSTGRKVGDNDPWFPTHACPVTPELTALYERQADLRRRRALAEQLSELPWRKLSEEQLRAHLARAQNELAQLTAAPDG